MLMRFFTAVIAITVGILVLLGYFLPEAAVYQSFLLDWAVILAGGAALVGVFNLLTVHFDKIRRRETGSVYSALLILSLVVTIVIGTFLGPQHPIVRNIFLNGVIIPVEATLMGLLAITLLYAAVRMLRKRADMMGIFFILAASVIFLGSATLPFGDVPVIGTWIRPWVSQILALGGARGILIGVALGTLTTGLRVLAGVDRPYGGK
ncbi:MAG TPA: hypothetical protein PK414_04155 [Anaerolineales bacterium]|nr:hypothetical protein [Anaerolineales bacterium]